VPERVETTDPEGIDFAWVMQTTFVLTIVLGAPVVALASIPVSLPSWGARASFAIRVGAIVWIVVAIGAFLYARRGVGGDRTGGGDGNGRTRVGTNGSERGTGRDRSREDRRERDERNERDERGEGGGRDDPDAERGGHSAASADAQSASLERSSET